MGFGGRWTKQRRVYLNSAVCAWRSSRRAHPVSIRKAVVPVPTPISRKTSHVIRAKFFVSCASESSCSRSKSLFSAQKRLLLNFFDVCPEPVWRQWSV